MNKLPTSVSRRSAPAIQSPKPFQEAIMTVITYGKSVTENAKTRRHARRRAAAIERDNLESIIDAAFGVEVVVPASVAVKRIGRIEKAVCSPSLRPLPATGAMCLPAVAIYSAGHRKVRKDATHIIK